MSLAQAKGEYLSLEAPLALIPILIALGIRTTASLATTADSPDRSCAHMLQPGDEFDRVSQALPPDFVELVSQHGNYHYFVNPGEIQWLKPSSSINGRPLQVTWMFGLYGLLLWSGIQVPTWAGLADLHLLVCRPGTVQQLICISLAIAALGLGTTMVSFKRGVKVASTGGLREKLFLYSPDRPRLVAAVEEGWTHTH